MRPSVNSHWDRCTRAAGLRHGHLSEPAGAIATTLGGSPMGAPDSSLPRDGHGAAWWLVGVRWLPGNGLVGGRSDLSRTPAAALRAWHCGEGMGRELRKPPTVLCLGAACGAPRHRRGGGWGKRMTIELCTGLRARRLPFAGCRLRHGPRARAARRTWWALLVWLFSTASAFASEAYTSLDDPGVTHFSDRLPAPTQRLTRVVLAPPRPVLEGFDPDHFSIAHQARRMQRGRLATTRREKARGGLAAAGPARASGTDHRGQRLASTRGYYGYDRPRRRHGRRSSARWHWYDGAAGTVNRGGYNAINGYAPLYPHRAIPRGRYSRHRGRAGRR